MKVLQFGRQARDFECGRFLFGDWRFDNLRDYFVRCVLRGNGGSAFGFRGDFRRRFRCGCNFG
jgi:hypothetical protein